MSRLNIFILISLGVAIAIANLSAWFDYRYGFNSRLKGGKDNGIQTDEESSSS